MAAQCPISYINTHHSGHPLLDRLPQSVGLWLDSVLRRLRQTLEQLHILADSSAEDNTSGESKAVAEARKQVADLQAVLDSLHTDRDTHQADLATQFGPGDVFRALRGACVERDAGEYTYEICFLERATQKSKKGGSSTSIGVFTRLEQLQMDDEGAEDDTFDDDSSSQARMRLDDSGSSIRWVMRFENGQQCWNGPARTTTAVLHCAEHGSITKIAEMEKCVYRIDVGTPAVCQGEPHAMAKDEL